MPSEHKTAQGTLVPLLVFKVNRFLGFFTFEHEVKTPSFRANAMALKRHRLEARDPRGDPIRGRIRAFCVFGPFAQQVPLCFSHLQLDFLQLFVICTVYLILSSFGSKPKRCRFL
ncbi:hypothetical protein V6Z12_D10G073800 [Gossypium hirsutum]